MNIFGEKVKISIFGESHGPAIGCVVDGLPAGHAIDEPEIARQMARRAPGSSALSTPRKEADKPEILSGIFEGRTTGAPICAIIPNTNTRSGDYAPHLPRPGHADLTTFIKYGGHADYRGGGHSSGRLTAPLVFAGALCRQILKGHGIVIGAHIQAIKDIYDDRFTCPDAETLENLGASDFPLIRRQLREAMENAILSAARDGDSVGGIIECSAVGVPAGLGSPFFGSMESAVSAMMYSIPGVKGVDFGMGFDITRMTGSQANDPIGIGENGYLTHTNNSGGINGGITNGMPIILRVAVRPTPSIEREQKTVDLAAGENSTVSVRGRHDPCIVPRALPVAEAGLAICLMDAMESGM